MHPLYIVGFEVFIVIMFGAFVRLDTSSPSSSLNNLTPFTGMLTFLLGFAMVGSAQRNLSWTSLGNVLVVVALCFQWSLLWSVFWNSCFQGFSVSFNLTITNFIQSAQSSLCTLLLATDLMGKLYYNQLMFICLIMGVGFTLNSAILNYALKIFDGGCAMQVFLLAGASCLIAWLVVTKIKAHEMGVKTYGYNTESMGLVGLLLVVYGWPSFNMAGAVITQANTLLTLSVVQSSAFFNTLYGMTGCIIFSLMLATPHSKVSIRHFLEAIISGGIMIGSFTDIIITPVMTMLLGGLASIGTIILFKYYGDSYILTSFAQPSLRILFGALSGIFAAIAVAARINDTTVLANNMSQVAGLELAGIAITIGVGCIVGSLSAVIIMFTAGPNSTEVNRDAAWWDIQQEMKQAHLHDSRFKEVNDFSPRINTSLLPKYKLDVPEGAGTIRKSAENSRLDSDRNNASQYVDNRQSPSHYRPEDRSSKQQGTIVRQSIYVNDPRKSEDFAARPTNMSGAGHIIHRITEEDEQVQVAVRPVGRQLDFDSVGSDRVAEEAQTSKIN